MLRKQQILLLNSESSAEFDWSMKKMFSAKLKWRVRWLTAEVRNMIGSERKAQQYERASVWNNKKIQKK